MIFRNPPDAPDSGTGSPGYRHRPAASRVSCTPHGNESGGPKLANALVTEVTQTDDGFTVTTEDGATHTAKYVVLAEGKGVKLNQSLGLSKEGRSVEVDRNGRTAVSGLYTVGRSTKMNRSQAIISAGEGASAALDILSTEAGKDVLDYDSPPKE